jgi:hypothetical protein
MESRAGQSSLRRGEGSRRSYIGVIRFMSGWPETAQNGGACYILYTAMWVCPGYYGEDSTALRKVRSGFPPRPGGPSRWVAMGHYGLRCG